MARRRKPHDPAATARQAAEREDREAEIKRLIAMGATVTTDPARRVISAYRSNFANLLLQRGSITQNHHDAASRLAADWSGWKGLDGGGDNAPERVDGGSGFGPKALVTDRMLWAGSRVAEAMRGLDAEQRKVMEALMVATVEEDRPMIWRGVVERVTGATNHPKQVQIVLGALESLRIAYEGPQTQHRVAA